MSESALPHEVVWTLTNAVVASRCLQVVAELGVADHIGDEPASAKDLAAACGADADALDRVLALLATFGVFEAGASGYGHTGASRLLRSDHPQSMRGFSRMMGLPAFRAMFDHLDYSVRTGAPAADLVDPGGLWAYLKGHPGEAEVFGHAMTAKSSADIASLLAAYDFGRFTTVADIGGGRGHLLRALLDANPATEGSLFDLPDVLARVEIDTQRLTLHAGDFFRDPLPAADGYVLMDIIHDWGDAEAADILRAVRRAGHPGARVLVVENVLAEDVHDPHGRTLDVIMLAVTGGRERTGAELGRLLESAGFGAPTIIETGGPLRIVEAMAI